MFAPCPPSSLPRMCEDLSRLTCEATSRHPEKLSCRCEVVPSFAEQKHLRWEFAPRRSKALPVAREFVSNAANSFPTQDISSRLREFAPRRREFLRSHRNSLRSAPRKLPKPSRLLLRTVYQDGELHPSLGNIGKTSSRLGVRSRRREALPCAASSFTDFLHYLVAFRACSRRWDWLFRPSEQAPSRSVFRRSDACSRPDSRRSLPAYPNSFSALGARTHEHRVGTRRREAAPSDPYSLPCHPCPFVATVTLVGGSRTAWVTPRASTAISDAPSGEGELTRGTGCSFRGWARLFTGRARLRRGLPALFPRP